MLILTTESCPGKEIVDVKGTVMGSTIQCKHIGKDIGASFKTIVGGEMKAYKDMMDEARAIAMDRMIKEAEKVGANAIVGFRLSTSAVIAGSAEVIAYGTAVVLA